MLGTVVFIAPGVAAFVCAWRMDQPLLRYFLYGALTALGVYLPNVYGMFVIAWTLSHWFPDRGDLLGPVGVSIDVWAALVTALAYVAWHFVFLGRNDAESLRRDRALVKAYADVLCNPRPEQHYRDVADLPAGKEEIKRALRHCLLSDIADGTVKIQSLTHVYLALADFQPGVGDAPNVPPPFDGTVTRQFAAEVAKRMDRATRLGRIAFQESLALGDEFQQFLGVAQEEAVKRKLVRRARLRRVIEALNAPPRSA